MSVNFSKSESILITFAEPKNMNQSISLSSQPRYYQLFLQKMMQL